MQQRFLRPSIVRAALVIAVLAVSCLHVGATPAIARTLRAQAPTILSGSGTASIVSSKTTGTVHVNGITLTSYTYVWKYSGVLNGIDHDFSNVLTYPDGTSVDVGVDVCVCTGGGLSGTISDQYYGSDNGKFEQGPATWGPGTGGFAGLHGSGSWVGSDKDYNHWQFTISAVVPWK